jgi:hypothetical protein
MAVKLTNGSYQEQMCNRYNSSQLFQRQLDADHESKDNSWYASG